MKIHMLATTSLGRDITVEIADDDVDEFLDRIGHPACGVCRENDTPEGWNLADDPLTGNCGPCDDVLVELARGRENDS